MNKKKLIAIFLLIFVVIGSLAFILSLYLKPMGLGKINIETVSHSSATPVKLIRFKENLFIVVKAEGKIYKFENNQRSEIDTKNSNIIDADVDEEGNLWIASNSNNEVLVKQFNDSSKSEINLDIAYFRNLTLDENVRVTIMGENVIIGTSIRFSLLGYNSQLSEFKALIASDTSNEQVKTSLNKFMIDKEYVGNNNCYDSQFSSSEEAFTEIDLFKCIDNSKINNYKIMNSDLNKLLTDYKSENQTPWNLKVIDATSEQIYLIASTNNKNTNIKSSYCLEVQDNLFGNLGDCNNVFDAKISQNKLSKLIIDEQNNLYLNDSKI